MAATTGRPAGRPKKNLINSSAPETQGVTNVPPVPSGLGVDGRRVWGILFSSGNSLLDDKIDVIQAEMFCFLYEETENMRRQLALGSAAGGVDAVTVMNKGQTLARHPYVQMVKDNRIMMNSILSAFGFTPADRARLNFEKELGNSALKEIVDLVRKPAGKFGA